MLKFRVDRRTITLSIINTLRWQEPERKIIKSSNLDLETKKERQTDDTINKLFVCEI